MSVDIVDIKCINWKDYKYTHLYLRLILKLEGAYNFEFTGLKIGNIKIVTDLNGN